eukprot:scaffold317085_cov18-Tisochrysis_lutea.AAC.1
MTDGKAYYNMMIVRIGIKETNKTMPGALQRASLVVLVTATIWNLNLGTVEAILQALELTIKVPYT